MTATSVREMQPKIVNFETTSQGVFSEQQADFKICFNIIFGWEHQIKDGNARFSSLLAPRSMIIHRSCFSGISRMYTCPRQDIFVFEKLQPVWF